MKSTITADPVVTCIWYCPGGCGKPHRTICKECELQKQIDHLSSRCEQLEKEVAELKKDPSAAYKRYKEDLKEKQKRAMAFIGMAMTNEEAPEWILGNSVTNMPNIEDAIEKRK